MNVLVNGKERDLPEACSVRDLLVQCELDRTPCAVEVNRDLVPRARQEEHRLHEGDTIEIVTLVGGG